MLDPSKGDVVIDYRQGNEAVIQSIKDALKGRKLEYAFDATAGQSSWTNICKVLDQTSGKITLVLPPMDNLGGMHEDIPKSIHQSLTMVGDVYGPMTDLGYLYTRYFTLGLKEGWFKAHPQEVRPLGLGGVQSGLQRLKNGDASATKYVYNIADTPGIRTGS